MVVPTHNSEKDLPTIAGLTDGKEQKLPFGIVIKILICTNSPWEVINHPCLKFYSSAAPVWIQAVSVILLTMLLGSVFVTMFGLVLIKWKRNITHQYQGVSHLKHTHTDLSRERERKLDQRLNRHVSKR